MTAGARMFSGVLLVVLILVLAFLLLPIVNVVAVSFTPSAIFDLPRSELSLRWYRQLWRLDSFWESFFNSLKIALLATICATTMGILCAIAIVRKRFPGHAAVELLITAPLMLPGLVIGIALLHALRSIQIYDALTGLLIAHVVITIPFVMRSVIGSLGQFDFVLLDAAQSLGMRPDMAVVKVLIPNIAPGVLSGALFAFITSFDNYSVSIFLTDPRVKTLPIQMLNYLDEAPDPSLAAISTVLIGMTVAILYVCDRMIGIRSLASE